MKCKLGKRGLEATNDKNPHHRQLAALQYGNTSCVVSAMQVTCPAVLLSQQHGIRTEKNLKLLAARDLLIGKSN